MAKETKKLRPFRVEDSTWDALKVAADKAGMGLAEYIRAVLVRHLRRQGEL